MSRAFVREPDGDVLEDIAERPVSQHPNDVTAQGLAQIEAEIVRLHDAHARAVEADDRNAVMRITRDQRYWTSRRATAHLMPEPADSESVQFGATVTLARDDGREQTFRIVGEDEADPAHGTLSHTAPLARALLGKQVGDSVKAGAGSAEILSIA